MRLYIFVFILIAIGACKKKTDSPPTDPLSNILPDKLTITDNGTAYTDSGYFNYGELQCIIKKTANNSELTLYHTADSNFPITLNLINVVGPLNSLGLYQLSPIDSSSIPTYSQSTFTEVFSGGEGYTVDSIHVNVTAASLQTVLGSYQIWLNNTTGPKTVTGTITCYDARIN